MSKRGKMSKRTLEKLLKRATAEELIIGNSGYYIEQIDQNTFAVFDCDGHIVSEHNSPKEAEAQCSRYIDEDIADGRWDKRGKRLW